MTIERDIPFNYTSADDRRIVALILGDTALAPLYRLMFKRRTGRSFRLLMRFLGDLFTHHRNPFLFQELVDNAERRRRFLERAKRDLSTIAQRGQAERDLAVVRPQSEAQVAELLKAIASLGLHGCPVAQEQASPAVPCRCAAIVW